MHMYTYICIYIYVHGTPPRLRRLAEAGAWRLPAFAGGALEAPRAIIV